MNLLHGRSAGRHGLGVLLGDRDRHRVFRRRQKRIAGETARPPMAVLHLMKPIAHFQEASAENEIRAAWRKYKRMEKYGLAFGKTCYQWQQKFATRSGVGNKGHGMVPILESLRIPVSTAYWWIDRYKESIGLKDSADIEFVPGMVHATRNHRTDRSSVR